MAADSFRQFCTDVGIPMNLNTDMAISFDGHPIVYQDVVRNNHINHSHAAARNQLKHIDIAIGHKWQSKMARNILQNAMVLRPRASRQHDAVYPAGT